MANLLADGMTWLAAQQQQSCAVAIVYIRGALWVGTTAMRGKTVFDVQDSNGYLLRVESEDFMILASTIVLDGIAELPQQGDRIFESATGLTFEVGAPGGSDAHYRFSDPYRTTVRVHAKEISA